MKLSHLNPFRSLVGRLFLFFWLTFIMAVLIAFFVGQAIQQEAEFGAPTQEELTQLTSISDKLAARPPRPTPLSHRIERLGRQSKTAIWVLDVESNHLILPPGPARRAVNVEQVRQLAGQSSPISFTTNTHRLIGPISFTYRGRQQKLFITKPEAERQGQFLIWIIPLAVAITIFVSFLFARTLARPIAKLSAGTKKLAKGNWDARVNISASRKDEIGQLANNFNQMAEQLDRLWSSQQRLLADISHELRSPLTRMQMAVGLAQQQKLEHPVVARIEKEALCMETLIGQLLTLTKMESSSAEKDNFTLIDVLSPLISDAKFEAESWGKQCNFSRIPDLNISVNLALIRSAIENVLRNAIKYCDSLVVVEVECDENNWKMSIIDDGEGLNTAECMQIFKPFYRVSTSRERTTGGTGLGLAIAKTAVELHHGTIHAIPHLPKGLKVIIDVPRQG